MSNKDGFRLRIYFFLLFGFIGSVVFAQPKAVQNNSTQPAYFIPNKGQFKDPKPYLYFVQLEENEIQIKSDGITWATNVLVPNKPLLGGLMTKIKKSNQSEESEEDKPAFKNQQSKIDLHFIGCNTSSVIIESNKSPFYYSYGDRTNPVYGFKELKFVDFYPNIDLIYTVEDQNKSFKFSFLLKSGADVSAIQYEYRHNGQLMPVLDKNELTIASSSFKLREYGLSIGPLNKQKSDDSLAVKYRISNGVIGYAITGNSQNSELLIDPFVIKLLDLTGSIVAVNNLENILIKTDVDDLGNIYVWGGGVYPNQPKLAKYTPSGNLIWIFMGEIPSMNWYATSYKAGNPWLYYLGTFVLAKETGYTFICPGCASANFTIIGLDDSGFATGFSNDTKNSYSTEGWEMLLNCKNDILYYFGGDWGYTSYYKMKLDTLHPRIQNFGLFGMSAAAVDITSGVMDDSGDVYLLLNGGSSNPKLRSYEWNNVIVKMHNDTSRIFSRKTGFDIAERGTHPLFPWKAGSRMAYGNYGLSNSSNDLAIDDRYVYYFDGRYMAAFTKDSGFRVGADSIKAYGQYTQAGIAADLKQHVFLGGDSAKLHCYTFKDSIFSLDTILYLNPKSNQKIHDVVYLTATQEIVVIGDSLLAKVESPYKTIDSNYVFSLSSQRFCGDYVVAKILTTPSKSMSFQWLDSTTGKLVRHVDVVNTDSDTLPNPIEGHVYVVKLGEAKKCERWLFQHVFRAKILKPDTIIQQLCEGDTFIVSKNRITRDSIFCVKLKTTHQCDSLLNYQISFLKKSSTNLDFNICKGDFIQIGKSKYFSAGNFSDTFSAANGCDSVVHSQIKVKPDTTVTHNFLICKKDTIVVGNSKYYQSGTYLDTFIRFNGCDSVIQTKITLLADTLVYSTAKICLGDSFNFGGSYVKSPGKYSHQFVRSNGCDSLVNLTLQALTDTTVLLNAKICNGETITIGAQAFKNAGSYSIPLQRQSGCDSIIKLNVTVLPTATSNKRIVFCNIDSFEYRGKFYPLPLKISDTVLAQNGCDSILKIDFGSKFVKAGIAIDTSNSPTVQFFSTSTNANFWKWNFGDLKSSVIENPLNNFPKSHNWIVYKVCLIVSDSTGCSDTLCLNLPMKPGDLFSIPEGISPNGDGVNDVLEISGLWEYPNAKWTIFNIWGQVLFKSSTTENYKWDGFARDATGITNKNALLPEGVYYIIFDFNDGKRPAVVQNLYLKK